MGRSGVEGAQTGTSLRGLQRAQRHWKRDRKSMGEKTICRKERGNTDTEVLQTYAVLYIEWFTSRYQRERGSGGARATESKAHGTWSRRVRRARAVCVIASVHLEGRTRAED